MSTHTKRFAHRPEKHTKGHPVAHALRILSVPVILAWSTPGAALPLAWVSLLALVATVRGRPIDNPMFYLTIAIEAATGVARN